MKYIRTTILQGKAEIAGGRVASFPVDGNTRRMTRAGKRMTPCSEDGSTRGASVTNVARISNQDADSSTTGSSTRSRTRGIV